MSDITMCTGEGCPVRKHCYRHTSRASERQSYFKVPPFDGKACNNYWSNDDKSLDRKK